MFILVYIRDITDVRKGWKTDTFNNIAAKLDKKYPDLVLKMYMKEERCFSIIRNDEKSLDLLAPNEDSRDLFVRALDYLLEEQKNQHYEEVFEK